MTEQERLLAALEYQEAQRPALMNPNLMRQGQRMNLPARQAPGPMAEFVTQAMSLDPQPDQGLGTVGAEMGLSLFPGVGQAMGLRDVERGRRANDPVMMGLGAASLIPVGKLISALRGGKQMGPVSELDVYHGSPHKMAPTESNPLGEFDPTKIGTGQGAQAYGYGHYLAENPKVAGGAEYRDPQGMFNRLTGVMNNREEFAHDMISQGREPAKVWEMMKQKYGQFFDEPTLKADFEKVSSARGNLYKVDLPDEQIAKMLDWDKPLSQQPNSDLYSFFFPPNKVLFAGGQGRIPSFSDWLSSQIRQGNKVAVGDNFPKGLPIVKNTLGTPGLDSKRVTGEQLYTAMQEWLKRTKGMSSDDASKIISEAMAKEKIPGIKYLDQGSRAGGKGTSNFVVFPGGEKMLNILERQ